MVEIQKVIPFKAYARWVIGIGDMKGTNSKMVYMEVTPVASSWTFAEADALVQRINDVMQYIFRGSPHDTH